MYVRNKFICELIIINYYSLNSEKENYSLNRKVFTRGTRMEQAGTPFSTCGAQ